MNLDESQKKQVSAWIEAGLPLSEIQKKLASDLGLTLTYMELRFLMDDLKLQPKEKQPTGPVDLGKTADKSAPEPAAPLPGSRAPLSPEPAAAGPGGVTVSVDKVMKPGSLVSGRVTFSDGNTAEWYLDQFGRLGLAPTTPGYKPPQQDLMTFQAELQNELARLGF
jgi:hypothetical protein